MSTRASDTDQTLTVSSAAIIRALAENPDISAYLAANPLLELADVRAALLRASSILTAPTSLTDDTRPVTVDSAPSPGLPEPDGVMHKGSVFRSILAPMKPGRLLDLGAEKPGFAVTATHLGWQVTAVGALSTDPAAEVEESDPDLAHLAQAITWVPADVREYPIERGEQDLVAIHSLLHRLTLEEQANLFRRCAGTPLLIDAKVANAVTERAGRYEGILMHERPAELAEKGEARDTSPDRAQADGFMLTEESLIRLARDSGFPIVLVTRPPHRRDFTFYLCLPKNWDAAGSGKGKARRLARRNGLEMPST
jgi:hypothetical protein